jgi:PqqD family protein of HPr-rel-A system
VRSGPAGRTPRWRAIPAGDLLWAAWDDHRIVFHRPSGITHFLNPASHYLIAEFFDEPRSLGEVADEMLAVTEAPIPAPDGFRRQILSLLMRLEQIGLIQRA